MNEVQLKTRIMILERQAQVYEHTRILLEERVFQRDIQIEALKKQVEYYQRRLGLNEITAQ